MFFFSTQLSVQISSDILQKRDFTTRAEERRVSATIPDPLARTPRCHPLQTSPQTS